MKQLQQRELDSMVSARDFIDANVATLGPIATSAGRRQLDTAISAITRFSETQSSMDRRLRGLSAREHVASQELKLQHMSGIAAFARARLVGIPEYAALTRPYTDLLRGQLVRAARSMASAAAPHHADLVDAGFPDDVLPQLEAAAARLEDIVAERASTLAARMAATVGIAAELTGGREAKRILDAVVTRRLVAEPASLAAWQYAKRVVRKPGPPQGGGTDDQASQVTGAD